MNYRCSFERCHKSLRKFASNSSRNLVDTIRLVGDPVLASVSKSVTPTDSETIEARSKLHNVLSAFRKVNGFGRGIAAPQIGISMRMIALNLGGDNIFTMHNPVLFDYSAETFTMFDDCFSFPNMLVRVRRHSNISVRYLDDDGHEVEMIQVGQSLAELLQHECDHLDGLTSFDRAQGEHSVIHRQVYEANKSMFDQTVDFSIQSTMN